jgi:hypothetical protein
MGRKFEGRSSLSNQGLLHPANMTKRESVLKDEVVHKIIMQQVSRLYYFLGPFEGYGLDIGFIDHSYTPLGTTSNCSAIANLHTLQVIVASAYSLPA